MKRPLSTPANAIVLCALGAFLSSALLHAPAAASSTFWELVETGGGVQLQILSPPRPPVFVQDQLFSTSDNSFISWVYQDAAFASSTFGHALSPLLLNAIYPWASVEMNIAADGCTLVSSTRLQGALGTTTGSGTPQPNIAPTVQFLTTNMVPAFNAQVTMDAYFVAALWGVCGSPVAVPCGQEVDKTGTGLHWEYYCGGIEPGWLVRVRTAGMLTFSWDGANLHIDAPLDVMTQFNTFIVPEPSSLLLATIAAAGLSGTRFNRRRAGQDTP